MGLLTGFTDALGLTDSGAAAEAAAMAQFKPYNINTTFGGVNYTAPTGPQITSYETVPDGFGGVTKKPIWSEATPGEFSTSLDPRLLGLSTAAMNELGQINPAQQLSLFRQQAAPFEEQQRLGLENRLFAQGRLDHSQVDQPGGIRRGLFDAQANADMMRQLQARDWANQQRAALLGQIGTIQGMEQGLFGPAMGMGQLGQAGSTAAAQMMMQGSMNTQNFFGSLLGGGLMGFGAGGGFNKLF